MQLPGADKSMTCLAMNSDRKQVREKVVSIFECVGRTLIIEEEMMTPEQLVQITLQQWVKGKQILAPFKVRLLLAINHLSPGLANRIIK